MSKALLLLLFLKVNPQIDPVEDLNGAASLLDEDLKVSEEVDLIEEDY